MLLDHSRSKRMLQCSHPGCGWQAVAPSKRAAWDTYAEHLVTEHARGVEATIPEGMVQVKLGADSEWTTVSTEEARELHEGLNGE